MDYITESEVNEYIELKAKFRVNDSTGDYKQRLARYLELTKKLDEQIKSIDIKLHYYKTIKNG